MPTTLLWVNKDSASTNLGRSSKHEDHRIRTHVQQQRLKKTQRIPALLTDEDTPNTTNDNLSSDSDESIRFATESQICARSGYTSSDQSSTYSTSSGSPPESLDFLAPLDLNTVRLSAVERRSLDFFVRRTAPEWCGWEDSHFWNFLTLQVAHQNESITHGLISLAAWHEHSIVSRHTQRSADLSYFLLQHWTKALDYARDGQRNTYLTNFINCVVLTCLEIHRVNFQSYRVLRPALALLAEFDDPTSNVAFWMSPTEKQLINTYVRPMLERMRSRNHMIGDRAASLARSCHQRRSGGLPPRQCPPIPSQFSSMQEARTCLEGILDWAADHVLDSAKNPQVFDFFIKMVHGRMNRWTLALGSCQPTNTSRRTGSQESLLSYNLLKVASLNGLVLLQVANATEETVYDAFVSQFTQIMDLLEALPKALPRGRVSFGIDSGMIDIVSTIATRCRDPTVRRRAFNFLKSQARVEGERWSVANGLLAQAWMDLEEGHLSIAGNTSITESLRDFESSDIPEKRRRRLLGGHKFISKGRLRIMFASSPYDVSKGAKVETLVFDIPSATMISKMNSTNSMDDPAGLGWQSVVENAHWEEHQRNAEVESVQPGCGSNWDAVMFGAPIQKSIEKMGQEGVGDEGWPDLVFNVFDSAFLEDRETGRYGGVETSGFFFPIPRV